MKKIVRLILGSIVAFTLSISAAFSAANEVRVAFFLEWATPNQEAKWSSGEKLKTLNLDELPKHVAENYQTYKSWLDNPK